MLEKRSSEGFFARVFELLRNDSRTDSEEGNNKFQRGSGGFEKDCLINAALNAYFVYEAGLFQVFNFICNKILFK